MSRPSTSYLWCAKNVDHRDIGAKHSFVASPGEWRQEDALGKLRRVD